MPAAASIDLPAWARVSRERAAHIMRVVSLIDRWAAAMGLGETEVRAWRDAARLHDALRDAPEHELREMLGDEDMPAPLLHGPATAARLRADGERREDVLDAIAHHTVGSPTWGAAGRALYMADFLDPGRDFARTERAALAARVPVDFDATFRAVVENRIDWARRKGVHLHPQSVKLWESIQ